MFQYLLFVLVIAKCTGFSSNELFDVFGTDVGSMDGADSPINHEPKHPLLEFKRYNKSSVSAVSPVKTSSDDTNLQDLLTLQEVERLDKKVATIENSINASRDDTIQDPWSALLEIEGLNTNGAPTKGSINPSSDKIVHQKPWSDMEVRKLIKTVATTKNSIKKSSHGTDYHDLTEDHAFMKLEGLQTNKRLLNPISDETVTLDPRNALLKVQRLRAISSSTERLIELRHHETVNTEAWNTLSEVERLNANSATTESSKTNSDDTASQDPRSSLLKVRRFSKSVPTTKTPMEVSSNITDKQHSWNRLLEVERLSKIVDAARYSTASNITVKQDLKNALQEVGRLDKVVTTTERSIGPAESFNITRHNETTTERFLRVTVGYRKVKPTRKTPIPFPLLNIYGCPEEERPLNLGAYEVPTQRDLVLHARRVLLTSYAAYHRKALRVLKQMKEATKASWPRENSCHASSKLMYRRCVHRVSKRCELTGKNLVLALEALKEDVMGLMQGTICDISAMNVDPIQLIRILAMEKVSLEFALPGFLRLLNACGIYCTRGPTRHANITQKRLRKLTDQQLVVSHFLTKKSYIQLLKGAT